MKQRRTFTLEQKVSICQEFKAAKVRRSVLAAHKLSWSCVNNWLRDPLIKAEIRKSKSLMKQNVDDSGINIMENMIGFDENEHRLIRFACASMSELLQGVLYKLTVMDTAVKK